MNKGGNLIEASSPEDHVCVVVLICNYISCLDNVSLYFQTIHVLIK